MRFLREFIALFLIVAALPFSLFGAMIASTPKSDQFRKIHSDERELVVLASAFVRNFDQKNARLPTYTEFSHWIEENKKDMPALEGRGVYYQSSGYPQDLEDAIGKAPNKGFAISVWSGSADVISASWSADKSLVYIPDSDYFVFGGKGNGIAVCFVCFLLFIGFAFIVWPPKKRKFNGQAHPNF